MVTLMTFKVSNKLSINPNSKSKKQVVTFETKIYPCLLK